MTRFRAAFTLFCLLAVSALGGPQPDAKGAIKQVFSGYKAALLEGNGSKAADLVSEQTIKYYEEILGHVLNLPRQKLIERDFISKFMILRLRHEFTKAEIAKLNGSELFALGVDKGWISKSSVANVELVEIKVREDYASGYLAVAPEIPAFHFRKESGVWKLDLLSSFELANAAMKTQIDESGLTEEEFVMRALAMLSTKKVDERILDGPQQ